jgi:hypothetical protein
MFPQMADLFEDTLIDEACHNRVTHRKLERALIL